jgi:hypothetical protein
MGGSVSHEYHYLSEIGEDTVLICESCGFAANQEVVDTEHTNGESRHVCPRCARNQLSSHRAIEVGHTFHLGSRYSEPLNAMVAVPKMTNTEGKSLVTHEADALASIKATNASARGHAKAGVDLVPLQMGCHGIGISRLIGAIAAMTADKKGLSWPLIVAPYHVVIVFDGTTTSDGTQTLQLPENIAYDAVTAVKYYGEHRTMNVQALIDDRDKPLPYKLKDADLMGYPVTVVLGRKWKEHGEYEIQCRSQPSLSGHSTFLATYVCGVLNNLSPSESFWKQPKGLLTIQELALRRQLNPQRSPGRFGQRTKDSVKSQEQMDDRRSERCSSTSPSPSPKHWSQKQHSPTSAEPATISSPYQNAHKDNLTLLEKNAALESTHEMKGESRRHEQQEHRHQGEAQWQASIRDHEKTKHQDQARSQEQTSQQSIRSLPQGVSREHLLEKVTLLERLMALRVEEENIKKQSGGKK